MNNKNIQFFSKSNGGSGSARNFGLEHATGDYVIFVDVDDLCEKDYIKLLVREMDKGADVAICGFDRFDANGAYEINIVDSNELTYEKVFEHIFASNIISSGVWNKMLRREMLCTYHLKFRKEIYKSEDALLIGEYYFYCKKISYIPKALYHYRSNPMSKTQGMFVTQKYDPRKDSMIDVGERIFDLYKEASEPIIRVCDYRLVRCCLWVMMHWVISGHFDKRNAMRIKKDIRKGFKGYMSLKYATLFQKCVVLVLYFSPSLVYGIGVLVKMIFPDSIKKMKG